MNSRAFLQLAQRLLIKEKNPEGFRTTISRAYYAAFNVTSEFLKAIDCQIPDGPQGHSQAEFRLNNAGDTALAEIATYLGDLRTERNAADYRLSKTHVEHEEFAQNMVDVAGRIIGELDTCNRSSQRKNKAKAAIKTYMKSTKQ